MENNMKKTILSIFGMLALSASLAFGQASLTQTTLSSAQAGGNNPSGITSNYQTTVSLTSATGVQAAFNGQPITFILVGNEEEGILSLVTGQTTIYNVLRGQNGTKVSPHASGDMVLISVVSPQFGGYQGSGGLQATDPPYNGACLSTATNQTPWVNVLTAGQWLCSSITGTWVPGFNSSYTPGLAKVTAAVASAAGAILPSGPLFHVTGTAAVTGFTIPVGFNATTVGGGQFCVIPDGAFTTTTAGNIAIASTAVVNRLLCFTWDATNSKFVPSY
jgi:hypothetical protein